jgi:hypothetical protein
MLYRGYGSGPFDVSLTTEREAKPDEGSQEVFAVRGAACAPPMRCRANIKEQDGKNTASSNLGRCMHSKHQPHFQHADFEI